MLIWFRSEGFDIVKDPPFDSVVADGALPARDKQEFSRMADMSAAVWLRHFENERRWKETEVKTSTDQFLLAAMDTPKNFKFRQQKSRCQGLAQGRRQRRQNGPRGIQLLSRLLTGAPTSMGQLLMSPTCGRELDRRLTKSGHTTQAIRRFLRWLAVHHGLAYSNNGGRYVESLQVRLSEPRIRGALKNASLASVVLDEVAGTSLAERHTASPLYTVIYKELLANALPGRITKRAPGMLTCQTRKSRRCSAVVLPNLRLVDRGFELGHFTVQ